MLISCAVTAQLICVFVYACVNIRFSHDMWLICVSCANSQKGISLKIIRLALFMYINSCLVNVMIRLGLCSRKEISDSNSNLFPNC